MQNELPKIGPQRPHARPLHPLSVGMDRSVRGALSASKNRRQPYLQDGAQTSVVRRGLVWNAVGEGVAGGGSALSWRVSKSF